MSTSAEQLADKLIGTKITFILHTKESHVVIPKSADIYPSIFSKHKTTVRFTSRTDVSWDILHFTFTLFPSEMHTGTIRTRCVISSPEKMAFHTITLLMQ